MNIEELQIQIESDASGASSGIDHLTKSLHGLKGATTNSAGLGKVSNALATLKTATQGLNLGNLGAQMGQLATALKPLEALGKNNLTSFVNSLKKVPEVTKGLDVTTTTAFAKAIERVAAAVRPLATEMQKISNGFSAMPKRLQSFITQMDKSATSSYKAAHGYRAMAVSLNSLNFKAAIAGLVYFGRRVASVFKGILDSATQYIEDINLVNISLGKYAGAISEYAQRAQDLLGIDAAAFMKNVGVFQSISTGLGVASDSAALMSQNLTQLGYDLASFYNISDATALEKLQSAITGQVKPMMELGVSVHQATLEEVALRHGIDQSVSSMTEAQKVMLRYVAIMGATKNAQGDLAATLSSPANQMRIFSQQVQLLSRSLGNLLIPILNKVIPYLLAFVKVLRMAADAVAAFFGVSLPTVDTANIDAISAGIGGAADNADDLASGLSGAAKEAKKLKDYMLGFDELNIIRPEDDTAAGGAGVGGGLGGGLGIELPQYDFLEGLQAQADALIPKMEKVAKVLGVIAGILAGVGAIKWLAGLVAAFATLGKLGGPIAAAFKGIGAVIGGISAPIAIVVAAIAALVAGLGWVYSTNEEVKASVDDAVSGIWAALGDALTLIAETVLPSLQAGWEGLMGILAPLGEFLAGMFYSIWMDMLVPAMTFLAETVIPVLAETFVNLWNNVLVPLGEFVGSVLGPVFEMLSQLLTDLWNSVIVPLAQAIGEVLGPAFTTLMEIINTVVIPVFSELIGVIQYLWDGVLGPLVSWLWDGLYPVFEAVFTAIGDVIESLKSVFGGLIDFIGGIFTADWSRVWDGVVSIFKGIFNLIPAAVEFVINGVIGIINLLTSGINWVTGLIGIPEIPAIPEVKLPRFKMGIDFIPYDDMPALLHKGEAVLTAEDAAQYRALGGMGNIMAMLAAGQVNTGTADMSSFGSADSVTGLGALGGMSGAAQTISVQDMYEAFSRALQANAALFEQGDTLVNLDGRTIYESNVANQQSYGYAGTQRAAVRLG